jgi:tyrosine ammonia-lyase
MTHSPDGDDSPLTLDPDTDISLKEAHHVATRSRRVTLSEGARRRVEAARERLDEWIDERRRIYGVTTGFGPLAESYIDPSERRELQQNLVYHLATGVGDPMEPRTTRAILLARAISLAQGHSGIRPDSLERLLACLNRQLHPVVPELGTVGASGDLTPLAHVALALMGEGEMWDDGERRHAGDVLEEAGLEPLELGAKEGLALVNGTSAMTGWSMLNGVDAVRAAETGLRLGLLTAECLGARSEAWHEGLGRVRPHPGQRFVHERLNEWGRSSDRLLDEAVDARRLALEDASDGVASNRELPQDPYSARCLPQLYGAVLDAVWQHNDVVETELNAVSDNPVVGEPGEGMLHGGNFYGQHVAFAADHAANAVVKTAIHLERCVARMTDTDRNGSLPPFLQGEQTGLHSGLMGAQVTATSLVAEMRTRSTPASTQSIPTNADNQDVVTMGTLAARRVDAHLERFWEIAAITAITCSQAVACLDDGALETLSTASQRLVRGVRAHAPPLEGDRPLSEEIGEVASHLRERPIEVPLVAPAELTDST